MTSEPDPLVVDREGLARMLRVSPRQVSRLHDAGKIPAPIALGGCKRWFAEEISDWLRAGAPPRRQWENLRSGLAAARAGEAGQH